MDCHNMMFRSPDIGEHIVETLSAGRFNFHNGET